MMRFLTLLLILVFPTAANACNVPVFRYALERWSPDLCDVIVFHDEPLTEAQQAFVDELQSASVTRDGSANIVVTVRNTKAPMDDAVGLLWDELRSQPDVKLPYLVVQSAISVDPSINNWCGSLESAMQAGLLTSPIRKTLTKRLMAGDAVVWLVLRSSDEDRNNAGLQLLRKQLKVLSDEVSLPEGIGLLGSELFSEIPLLMKFSVLELDAADEQEQFLVKMLKEYDPAAVTEGDPLIVPIFGRGRVLDVIPASQTDKSLIEDITMYLCGACSCQVKGQNPGFDMLISASWDEELFGELAEEVSPRFAAVAAAVPSTEPELVPIPAGKPVGQKENAADTGYQGLGCGELRTGMGCRWPDQCRPGRCRHADSENVIIMHS